MFRNLPPVTKNLLLINFVVFLFDAVFQKFGIRFAQYIDYSVLFGLNYCTPFGFHFWQPVTYMFMHANFSHIFCNMFAVLMFAPALEQSWGARRFTIYYFICGIGAAAIQMLVWALFSPGMPAVTIGASGAVFGVLFAFAWLFPDVPMFIFFIPIPIRARTLVLIYAVIELLAGISGAGNVAHFAHLGGMLFGWLVILWWRHSDHWHFPKLGRRKEKDDDASQFDGWHYQKPL
ncbi:MAG: rhomboid family intramembrane serine protease [Paludibacteraceae bacterium]|nr:rhomboid family intramembrane serine protease [Paludibacteraceae bacterium]